MKISEGIHILKTYLQTEGDIEVRMTVERSKDPDTALQVKPHPGTDTLIIAVAAMLAGGIFTLIIMRIAGWLWL